MNFKGCMAAKDRGMLPTLCKQTPKIEILPQPDAHARTIECVRGTQGSALSKKSVSPPAKRSLYDPMGSTLNKTKFGHSKRPPSHCVVVPTTQRCRSINLSSNTPKLPPAQGKAPSYHASPKIGHVFSS
mmetsp:Transcript_20528/g.41374  ORF Transcript_20528/g.41374 Transcript_20528/m.41374 type:complete len:129 (+) Transcript_20528:1538-1924(+)